MDKRGRVLVVDDERVIRESYVSILSRDQFGVDAAATLDEAREAIDRREYHAALVDIMLAGNDTRNRDGAMVLKYLHEHSRGTRMLVLSGQSNLVLVRDILKDYPHLEYVFKKEISDYGAAFLLEKVGAAVAAAMAERPIKWGDALGAMAGGLSEEAFVSACLQQGFKGGFENLSRSICSAYEQLFPLVAQVGTTIGLRNDRSPDVMSGTFWSKGRGKAIDLLLFGRHCSRETLDELWSVSDRNVVYERTKADLSILALERPDLNRNQFLDADAKTNA